MMLLQHTVRAHAERRPEAVAMVFNQQRMTYGELEESSNRLAQMLKAVGCQRGDRVGLLVSKSIPAIVGMIGILKAECVYVPLDNSSPAPRLARMVQVCEPKSILAEGATVNLLSTLL